MFIRLLSDLHTEFMHYGVEEMPNDHETVLVLAGDIGLFKHAAFPQYLMELHPRFRKIIMVAGNHEFYGSTLIGSADKFKSKMALYTNFHLLEKEMLVVDDVLFIGATLWTSFRGGNPMSMMEAETYMNDYRQIRHGGHSYRKIQALDTVRDHEHARDYIFHILKEHGPKYRKVVVVTHQGPSYQSVPPQYHGHVMNDAYVSDLDNLIWEYQPDAWYHGHTHSSFDYTIGKTRVVTNPKGYPKNGGWENSEFNPTLTFEL